MLACTLPSDFLERKNCGGDPVAMAKITCLTIQRVTIHNPLETGCLIGC